MNIDWKLVVNIAQALWDNGILTAVAGAVISFVYKYSKNKNILNFEKWCAQGVVYAEKHFTGSESKKQAATDFVLNRLGHNWFTGFFNNKQISAELETQLLIWKNKGLEDLKTVANSAPIHTKAPDKTAAKTKNVFPEHADIAEEKKVLASTQPNSVVDTSSVVVDTTDNENTQLKGAK